MSLPCCLSCVYAVYPAGTPKITANLKALTGCYACCAIHNYAEAVTRCPIYVDQPIQIGDLVTGRRPGYWVVESIDTSKMNTSYAGARPTYGLRKVAEFDMTPLRRRARDRCNGYYVQPITRGMLDHTLQHAIKTHGDLISMAKDV